MNKKKFTKLLALYLPYLVIGLAATNLGESWRLAEGKELGDKIVSLIDTLPAAFANPLPSLHPLDILVGICCGAGLRLAVYLKSKNAKKYRHGMEYGSARWGTPADIAPFMAPKFEDNIILTKTERLMMSNRPPDPKNARNKNVLVVGGSGSGKTRYFIKPNLLQYTEDYYDNDMTSEAELVAPEWKVYFDGDFWGHRGKDRAGKEIKLDKQFDWAGYHWVIPAAYSCSKGLVVDFCMRVDSESIRDFMKKWNLDWENDSCENFTREQQMQMEWENPLCFNFKPCLKLNEKILQTTHGCAVSFNPCLPDGVINELEAKWAIDHYGLDSTYGWVICRDVFPWGTKHHPEINKLFLTMEQQPGQVPGSHFKVHAPGDSFMFSHPVSGITHTLTVQEIEQQTVPQNSFGSDRWIYPTHYIAMSYTLTPEPMENISVFDCDEGDRPIEVTPDDHSFRPVGSSSCFVVGVIGGADGPTAVIYGTNSQEKLHAACSALHFEPVGDDVEWRIVFNVTQFDKETFPII